MLGTTRGFSPSETGLIQKGHLNYPKVGVFKKSPCGPVATFGPDLHCEQVQPRDCDLGHQRVMNSLPGSPNYKKKTL